MIARLFLVAGALVVGAVSATLVPELAQTTRSVAAAVPGLARLVDPPKAAKSGAHDEHGSGGEGHGAAGAHGAETAQEAQGSEGVLKLDSAQIGAAKIKTEKVSGGTLARRLLVPGIIVPAGDRIGRVAAKVVGTVTELNKQLGDPVEKGEIVAVLDSREVAEAKSEYLAARVNLELQKTLFDRERSLFQKNITAEQQFLRAKTAFAEVQLRLDLASQKLAALGLSETEIASLSRSSTALQRYDLRAPIGGRIVERLVNLGAPVGGEGQAKELYGIADLSRVWVELSVSPRDLPSVKERLAVQIMAAGRNEKGVGKIVFRSPMLNTETRSARIIAEIPNEDGSWQPGSFVTAAIIVEEQDAELVVPKTALQTLGKDNVVFVRTPEGFEKREVALGRSDGQYTEVVFGLDPGEEIAVANSFILKAELGKAEASHAH